MEKYTVLISHPIYGSSYRDKNGVLTKWRFEAKKFSTVEKADKEAKKEQKESGWPCAWCLAEPLK